MRKKQEKKTDTKKRGEEKRDLLSLVLGMTETLPLYKKLEKRKEFFMGGAGYWRRFTSLRKKKRKGKATRRGGES